LISNINPAVSLHLTAGLLLAALPHFARLGLPAPTATAVLDATGSGRTRAYELRAAVDAVLPTLQKPLGRPPTAAPPAIDTSAITCATLDYLISHPGAVTARGARRWYSDGFRAEVLHSVAAHPEVDRERLADAVRVPRATLDDWLADPASPERETTPDPPPPRDPIATENIATLIDAWNRWQGGFAAFGAFVRDALEIPYGDTRIGQILAIHSNRRARRRMGRRSDEKATRDAFLTFFPGAQWTEDGSPIAIDWCGERFTFNWELVVDTASGACVGADVRSTENTDAVIAAYNDAVSTTGAAPFCLNTDNATENDGPGMAQALGETPHLHATLGRPQNDCHVEGAFGLFQQTAPPLVIAGQTSRQCAHSALVLILTLWMRTLNQRPRRSHGGKSRVGLYLEAAPTPEQIAEAKAALADIQRRHDQAEKTRRARAHPTARALLDAFFEAHDWEDSERRLRDAIAGYPIDAVIAAIAIFEGKDTAGRLPPNAEARYLLGITRNISDEREGLAIAEALWKRRLEAQDHFLTRLAAERDAIQGDAQNSLAAFTERVLQTDSTLQRTFWQDAIAETLRNQPKDEQKVAFDHLTRTVHAAYRIPSRERALIVRDIAERTIPVV
jgi:hypothetical protein